MDLALIGSNDDSLRLAKAIAATGEHTIRRVLDADHHRNELFDIAPGATWDDDWETLLVEGEVDAVVAASHSDVPRLEDQLRKLTQAGVPLIVTHPLHDSLFAYELEMIREDVGGTIIPYFAGIMHPAWSYCAEFLQVDKASAIGPPEQVLFERHLEDRDRGAVLATLSHDLTTLRHLIGDITSINAVGGATDETAYANLCVNLVGNSGSTARWSVSGADGECVGNVTLIGADGKSILTMTNGDSSAQWNQQTNSDERKENKFDLQDEFACLIDQLECSVASRGTESDWEGICHDLEVVEQTERSLKRKRTIELRRDSQTEEGTFKGLMSAGSCLMLLLVLFGFFVFAVVEGFRMPVIDYDALREQSQPAPRANLFLRLWPVYPLAAFLLMQLLLFVAKQPKKQNGGQPR
ncbi:MAG: hypothetical protein CMJ64_14750 [Planctomycetaceae bacterium]|nr:hypothetical protein [Planctomycetaceae bacterium]